MINSTRSTYSFKEVVIKDANTDDTISILENQVSYTSDNDYETNEYISDWNIGELPDNISEYEDDILEELNDISNSDLEKQDTIDIYISVEE